MSPLLRRYIHSISFLPAEAGLRHAHSFSDMLTISNDCLFIYNRRSHWALPVWLWSSPLFLALAGHTRELPTLPAIAESPSWTELPGSVQSCSPCPICGHLTRLQSHTLPIATNPFCLRTYTDNNLRPLILNIKTGQMLYLKGLGQQAFKCRLFPSHTKLLEFIILSLNDFFTSIVSNRVFVA